MTAGQPDNQAEDGRDRSDEPQRLEGTELGGIAESWTDEHGLVYHRDPAAALTDDELHAIDAAIAEYGETDEELRAEAAELAWEDWLTGATFAELSEVWRAGRCRGAHAYDLARQLQVRREHPHPADLEAATGQPEPGAEPQAG
ncbi:hypothetical protein AB0I28_31975 [Phytomonospora sp. NPDC050363]|uniref:hypothetical protein n=1 Tax=Phytomonospora sp. NPDC050363 TaxID=3155642 RepID=UPI0033FF2226